MELLKALKKAHLPSHMSFLQAELPPANFEVPQLVSKTFDMPNPMYSI
jgi:hypothetical protein